MPEYKKEKSEEEIREETWEKKRIPEPDEETREQIRRLKRISFLIVAIPFLIFLVAAFTYLVIFRR